MISRASELIHTTFIDGVSGALSIIPEIYTDYTRFNEKFDEVTNRLYRNWDGRGAEAFEEDTVKIRQNIQSLYVQLKELWDTLCDCHELIKLADGQIGLKCRETGAQLSFDTWIQQMNPSPGGGDGVIGAETTERQVKWAQERIGGTSRQCWGFVQDYTTYFWGEWLTATGVGGPVDFITGASTVPPGWTIIAGGTPQPGDIVLFNATTGNGGFGHAGIAISGTHMIDANGCSNANFGLGTPPREHTINNAWGVIRPPSL